MKILFISTNAPCPPTGGDRQRTDLLYRALSRLGDVDYLLCRPSALVDRPLLDTMKSSYRLLEHLDFPPRGKRGLLKPLRSLNPLLIDRLAYTFGSASTTYDTIAPIADAVERIMTETPYDLVVCRYLPAACAAAPWRFAPTIIDIDDYLPQVYAQRIAHSRKPWVKLAYGVRLNGLKKTLPTLMNNAQHLWLPNPADKPMVEHRSISILPNIAYRTDDSHNQRCNRARNNTTIAMIGSLNYRVNVAGLDYFLTECWPVIRQQCKIANFRIIGNGLNESQRLRWSAHDGVEVVGFVEDLKQAYDECAFCVVPVREGGGTKIKVVEALAHARTVVMTPHSLRGFDHVLKHDDSVLVASSGAEFATACLDLLNDPDKRDRLAAVGNSLVEKHFSTKRFNEIVEHDVQRVVSRH